jgi:hypothetical protein
LAVDSDYFEKLDAVKASRADYLSRIPFSDFIVLISLKLYLNIVNSN